MKTETLRDSKKIRWGMLFIVSFLMFAAYVASDNLFSVERTLMDPDSYAVTQTEYDNLAGAYSIFNVYLFMLIFGGLLLDKAGIRITGIISSILMVVGIGITTAGFITLHSSMAAGAAIPTVRFLGATMRVNMMWAVVGIGIYGVGAEIAGITVTKIIAKWFMGYELALAMGLQIALARLGTGLSYGLTPLVVKLSNGLIGPSLLIGLGLLVLGTTAYFIYCAFDAKLDKQTGVQDSTSDNSEQFHLKDTMEILKNPAFWMIAILCLLFYSSVNPFLKYSTGIMTCKFGVDPTVAGIFPMMLPMGCILLTPLFGSIYDKKGHGADLMILGAVLIIAVHLTFSIPFITSKFVAVLLMLVLGVGYSMLPSAMWPSIAKIMPPKLLGTTMALTFYIQNIGFIFTPKAVGAIKTATDNNYNIVGLFFAGLGLAALTLAICIKILDRKKNYGLQLPNIK